MSALADMQRFVGVDDPVLQKWHDEPWICVDVVLARCRCLKKRAFKPLWNALLLGATRVEEAAKPAEAAPAGEPSLSRITTENADSGLVILAAPYLV